MKTKIIPFYIELAKKIQSGEVEGRIVTKNGGEARILAFDSKACFVDSQIDCYTTKYNGINKPLVVEYLDVNGDSPIYQIVNLLANGKLVTWGDSDCDLVIELPEATLKHDFIVGESVKIISGLYFGSSGTIEEIIEGPLTNKVKVYISANIHPYLPFEYIERCSADSKEEAPKYEFKVGDVVKVIPQDGKHSEWIIGFGPVIARVLCQTSEGVLLENKDGFIDMFSLDEIQFITDASHDSNHEFKPFDRVLVRDCDKDEWHISFFSHIKDGWFVTDNGHIYDQCIPYKGNEYLVGTTRTTDKPKEC